MNQGPSGLPPQPGSAPPMFPPQSPLNGMPGFDAKFGDQFDFAGSMDFPNFGEGLLGDIDFAGLDPWPPED
jgi:hypothetical protein